MTSNVPLMWVDGQWGGQALGPAVSHGMNYACGVFDTARLYKTPKGPAFFRLDDHVDRLFSAMRFAGFTTRFTPTQVNAAVKQLAKKNKLASGYVRMNAFLPQEELRVFPNLRNASLAIMASTLDYAGKDFHDGVHCQLSAVRKPRSEIVSAGIKFSANYLPAYLTLRNARAKGFDEAILLDSLGFVAEATAQNLFLVKGGVLITPSTRSEILPGLTRDTILVLARHLGFKVKEADVSTRQLLAADEVFLTGTATEIMPVTKIGTKRFAVGPVTSTLKIAFDDSVSGRHGFFKTWLTYL